jgi:hypothetical protein
MTTPMLGLVSPEVLEHVAMPAQQGIGLDNQQGLSPGGELTGKQHQEQTIFPSEPRSFALSSEHDQRVAQQGIFEEEVGFAAREVGYCPDWDCVDDRFGPGFEKLTKGLKERKYRMLKD